MLNHSMIKFLKHQLIEETIWILLFGFVVILFLMALTIQSYDSEKKERTLHAIYEEPYGAPHVRTYLSKQHRQII